MDALRNLLMVGILIIQSYEVYALDVIGEIPNGTIWSITDSPVIVTGDLNIVELTVEPGVEIHVTGNYEIVVSGIIHSLGTQESPVVFKPSDGNLGGWGGFYMEDTIPGSEFLWTHIEGADSSGIHVVRSYPTFDHVTFKENRATYGGAIRAEISDRDLLITNSLFVGNFASIAGGAVYTVGPSGVDDAALKISESVFRQNRAGTTSDTLDNTSGGAIYVQGNSSILSSIFTENEAQAYTIYALGGRYTKGGALYLSQGFSDVNATIFNENACRMDAHYQTPDASRAYGGAIHLASGELRLNNSLLINNELDGGRYPDHRGSGVYIASGISHIINSTLARNDTHAVYRDSGEVDILNSILFFNNSGESQIAGSAMAGYSDIQNGLPGEGNIDSNPMFVDVFHLSEGSPCIDTGSEIEVPIDDLDGRKRPLGKGFDMGAYEFPLDYPIATILPSLYLLLLDR